MKFLDIIGTTALITTIIGLFPQIYKVFKTKSAKDISMVMLVNFFACSLAWIIYGIGTQSKFIIESNSACLISAIILIMQKKYYDKN